MENADIKRQLSALVARIDSRTSLPPNSAPPATLPSEDIAPALALLNQVNEGVMDIASQTVRLSEGRGLRIDSAFDVMKGYVTEQPTSEKVSQLLVLITAFVRQSRITVEEYILRIVMGISFDLLLDHVFALYAPGMAEQDSRVAYEMHKRVFQRGLLFPPCYISREYH